MVGSLRLSPPPRQEASLLGSGETHTGGNFDEGRGDSVPEAAGRDAGRFRERRSLVGSSGTVSGVSFGTPGACTVLRSGGSIGGGTGSYRVNHLNDRTSS